MRSKSESIMKEIVDYINSRFFDGEGVPSLREIAEVVGLDKSNVSRYLSEMERRGMIRRNGGYYGTETEKMRKAVGSLKYLPVVGVVACGGPILAEENIESYLSISGDFLGVGEHFVLRASGDSMIDAGINDGDYVIIRKQSSANEGDIAVAMVDGGECTLKKYYRDKGSNKIRLHPMNKTMSDMLFDHVEIQGVAIKVIKSLA